MPADQVPANQSRPANSSLGVNDWERWDLLQIPEHSLGATTGGGEGSKGGAATRRELQDQIRMFGGWPWFDRGPDPAGDSFRRRKRVGREEASSERKTGPMDTQAQSTGERGQEANGDARSDRELREANRHLREFLGLLGHELRSPLAAIRNALQLLERQGDDAVTRERVRGMMERQTQSIGRLVEDMLEVSRIEHGRIPLCKQTLDLADVVARAIETVRASVENCGHRLEVSLPPGPVALNADPARLEQVLTNLLNNAAKYMERGGRIWVTAEALGGDVVLRVRDSGIGIDPGMLPHVFDPFWQLERTLDHSQGGLGLGLPLVRKLAEMHGGSASAYSAGLGSGSEFVVRIPAHTGVSGNGSGRGHEQHAGASLT